MSRPPPRSIQFLQHGRGPPPSSHDSSSIPQSDIYLQLLKEVREAHSRILTETKHSHDQVSKEASLAREDITKQYESLKRTASYVQIELKKLQDQLGNALQQKASIEQLLTKCNEIQSKHADSKEQLAQLTNNLRSIQEDLHHVQRSYDTLKGSNVSSPNLVPITSVTDAKQSVLTPVSPIALPQPIIEPSSTKVDNIIHSSLVVDPSIQVKWVGLRKIEQDD